MAEALRDETLSYNAPLVLDGLMSSTSNKISVYFGLPRADLSPFDGVNFVNLTLLGAGR